MVMKTPGVYIVEKNAFPNSVVQVATAVPAFIGYTEWATNGSQPLANTPFRITSMSEFHTCFGGLPTPVFKLAAYEPRSGVSPLTQKGAALAPELPEAVFDGPGTSGTFQLTQVNPAYALYGAMRLFFENGGGACYVTSIGSYADPIDAEAMLAAIESLKKEAEPTILVIPETTRLARQDAVRVQQAMLMHCGIHMKNRFAILDISGGYLPQQSDRGDAVATFRTDIGTNGLDFGAAYYPWLNTSVFQSRDFSFLNIEPAGRDTLRALLKASVSQDAETSDEIDALERPVLRGDFTLDVTAGGQIVLTAAHLRAQDLTSPAEDLTFEVLNVGGMAGRLLKTGTDTELSRFTQADLDAGAVTFAHDAEAGIEGVFDVIVTDANGVATRAQKVHVHIVDGSAGIPALPDETRVDEGLALGEAVATDKQLRATVPLYRKIMDVMAGYVNAMSPGAAMAGLYTMVDNNRGVWNAPANISVNSVSGPMVNIDNEQQQDLNVTTTGKSINAIRPFVGEGTLVWGARTLDGNSLDWRYINVRRMMIMIEQSIWLACKAYVFEPNTAQTWVTMRSMIENFLTGIWKEGGLAGAVPAEAFSVHLGLGETMTPLDVSEGILRVTVRLAAVRPAEFIEISIQQQMQVS